MTIVDQLTVTRFKFASLELTGRGADLSARASITLLNEDNQVLQRHMVDVPLSAVEQTVLESRIAERLATFASATGWTEV
jgi:hypothetical protein